MKQSENQLIRDQYDRIAGRYDLVDWLIPSVWRRQATMLAYGRVLEAGVGTGLNLPYYKENCQAIVGVDLSRRMLEAAERRRVHCKVPLSLVEMDIQALSLESASFDCVLVAFVFCTVPDPEQGLRECYRVLKPGGKLILLEHMGSDKPWLRKVMNWLNPLTVSLMGDHINRRTARMVETVGFSPDSSQDLFGDVVRLITAKR